MSKIIIYDYEIFMYDSLLGCNIIDETGNEEIYQTWNLNEIKDFYYKHQNDLWIGHNNFGYDDYITDAIVNSKKPYLISQKIMKKEMLEKVKSKLYSFDLMKVTSDSYSLKDTELLCGKKIHVSDVSFDTPRPLTEEEKKLEEEYNKDDLIQTTYNFNRMKHFLKLRLDIVREFNIPLEKGLKQPGYLLAAEVLHAYQNPSLKYMKRPHVMYENLQIKNQALLDYYKNELYKTDKNITIECCGTELTIGKGGTHGADNKLFCSKLIYADVSGYYNLIALLYDLLPRNLSDEAKLNYRKMYEEQLRLKKIDPAKREAFKTILLAVIGAMKMENSPFYDPETYLLLTITGQLFIVDLLEKLEGLIYLIQANTDGIMIEPIDWNDEDKIREIIKEWEKRTGFNIKVEFLYRLFQRDVNCYCCVDENDKLIFKGDALKNYDISDEAYGSLKFFKCKEPPIIAQGIVNFLMYEILPEDYVMSVKNDLRLFQYICKKGTASYLTYEKNNITEFETEIIQISSPSRVFALKSNSVIGTVYKHFDKFNKSSAKKYPSLPENVFIYNEDINGDVSKVVDMIDYQYYIDRIKKKIKEFI